MLEEFIGPKQIIENGMPKDASITASPLSVLNELAFKLDASYKDENNVQYNWSFFLFEDPTDRATKSKGVKILSQQVAGGQPRNTATLLNCTVGTDS